LEGAGPRSIRIADGYLGLSAIFSNAYGSPEIESY
jgi:hypothetical protein